MLINWFKVGFSTNNVLSMQILILTEHQAWMYIFKHFLVIYYDALYTLNKKSKLMIRKCITDNLYRFRDWVSFFNLYLSNQFQLHPSVCLTLWLRFMTIIIPSRPEGSFQNSFFSTFLLVFKAKKYMKNCNWKLGGVFLFESLLLLYKKRSLIIGRCLQAHVRSTHTLQLCNSLILLQITNCSTTLIV